MTARRRRPRGEGGVFEYRTAAGAVRFGIKFDLPSPDSRRRQVMRRRDQNDQPWLTHDGAVAALREALVQSGRGEWIDPSKQPTGEYLESWLEGLRLAPSTVASYRKNVRLHIAPYIGTVPLASLTPARIAAMYRTLENSGRADHRQGAGLSARTVRYVATILRAALGEAVAAGMIARNPADPERAKPPTAREARAPEMHPWTAGQLAVFLDWSREHSQLHAAWWLLAMTGMRRGGLLALRWRDIDLDAGTASIRRSAGVVRNAGEGARRKARPRPASRASSTWTPPPSPCSGPTAASGEAWCSSSPATAPWSSATTRAVTVTRRGSPAPSPSPWPGARGCSATTRRRGSGCTTSGTPTRPSC